MPQIIWNTDVKAPCCPGEILNSDNASQSVLVQSDWHQPAVAQTFGWSLREVQRAEYTENNGECDHDGTDGTVDCPDCGVTASAFIKRAGDWLTDNDGATAEDQGTLF